MQRLILGAIIIGLLLTPGLAAASPIVGVASVIDGDTIENTATNERIRIANIDTAETGDRARCAIERRHNQIIMPISKRWVSSSW